MQKVVQLTEQDLIHVISKISNEMRYMPYDKSFGKRKLFEQTKPVAKPQTKPAAQNTVSTKSMWADVKPAGLSPQQIEAQAKAKINAVAQKEAQEIYNSIKSAFDMDGDGDLRDWDGTNESTALKAIRKISSKETLNLLNQLISKQGQYSGLKDWVNDEMSDFDSEYGDIWTKLESLGYSGHNRNLLYKIAGYSPVGLVVKGVDKGIDALRSMSLEDIMEGFREIVGGVGGTIAQIIIGFTGPIGAGIILAINGILLGWDIYQLSTGSQKFSWFNLIMDLLGTTLAGAGLKSALKPAQAVLQAEKTLPGFFGKMAQRFPDTFKIFQGIGNVIGKAAEFVVNLFKKGVQWITKYVPFLKNMLAPLERGLGKLSGIIGDILKSLAGAGGKVVAKVGSTITGVSSKIAASKVGTTLGPVLKKVETQGLKFLETKFGQKALETTDQFAVNRVEEYLKDKGYHLPIQAAQAAMCKVGSKECVAMKAIAQAAG